MMEKVTLGPSNVSGMGVFTLRKIKQGEVVCIYSGKLLKTLEDNHSKYLLTGKIWDPSTKRHLVRHIDSSDRKNAIARYINDACDSYTEKPDLPDKYKTEFHTNVGYRYVRTLQQHHHPNPSAHTLCTPSAHP